jgi:hypothetical protein
MIGGVWEQGADENFEPKRGEVIEGRGELHNEEIYYLHPSANEKEFKMDGDCVKRFDQKI